MNSFQMDDSACKRWKTARDGTMVLVPKVQHATMDEANHAAKTMNGLIGPGGLRMVAYKCKTCHKYHIGPNGNRIKDEDL